MEHREQNHQTEPWQVSLEAYIREGEPEQAEKLRSRAHASESTDKMAGIFFIFKILSGVL